MKKRAEIKELSQCDKKTLEFISGLTSCLRPKEKMTVSEWAEAHMVLPEGSAISGKFSCDVAPYQREIMDAITDPGIRDVVVMSSAQVGKTAIILAGMAYFIDHEPSTQMMVMPTIQTMEKFSKSRLKSMIEDVPELRAKVGDSKTRSAENTLLYKAYAGGYMILAGSNSPSSLNSFPIRIVWMDEIDRFPGSAGDEGNPVRLAEARANSYWNKKFFKSSTPTTVTTSKINEEFEKGTREEWCVQCPCCGTFQPYEWDRVEFDVVGMKCAECGEVLEERFWRESEHKWITGNPDAKGCRSFHLNALASPWVRWQDLIDQFRSAVDKAKRLHDTYDLQTFYNLQLGEVWDDTRVDDKSQSKEEIQARAEEYGCEIPDGVILLTAAVDVQDNRFEVEVRGWAREYETWGIYKTEIYGDIEKNAVWEQLEDYLKRTFTYSDGRRIGIVATAIDTGGGHTESVYRHCRDLLDKDMRIYPVKGYANKEGIKLLYHASKAVIEELTPDGKKIVKAMIPLQILGVNAGKEMIMSRLTITEPGEGYCHFPSDEDRGYDEAYYDGLTSEHKITTMKKGALKTEWKKVRGRANEPFDLFNYNLACCQLINPDWDALEDKVSKGVNYTERSVKRPRSRHSRRRTIRSDI